MRGQVVSDDDESPLVGAVVQVVGASGFMTKTKLNGWLVNTIWQYLHEFCLKFFEMLFS